MMRVSLNSNKKKNHANHMNVLLIGSGAREHAIAKAIKRSAHQPALYVFGGTKNPGIAPISDGYTVGAMDDAEAMLAFAKEHSIDWAIVGPETPLEAGISDMLWAATIPCIGPKKQLAQLESSKSFTRDLTVEYNIPGRIDYQYFTTMDGVDEFLDKHVDGYVVKADGLMGGKGVKVSGDHLHSKEEAKQWCQEIIDKGMGFLLEEKLIGQEFSFISICDGTHLAHTFAIQDHKRAHVGDEGPNTGGMGTYSDMNHSLPFLRKSDIEQAKIINQATAGALKAKFSEGYKGVLYGGFMVTADGVKLIEYNARFGDPEAENIFSLLESDFVDTCLAIINGNLTQNHFKFANKASVCKFVATEGYPTPETKKHEPIDISEVKDMDRLLFAGVVEEDGQLYGSGRAIAVVGIGNTISEAEQIAEAEAKRITGNLFHREDIGTPELIDKRVQMMRQIRN